MRKAALLLLVLVLVNLPWVDEWRTDRRVERDGRLVSATLLAARERGGHYFVDYRLPRSVDGGATRFSAEVDATTYEAAQESRVLPVRVVPGHPTTNRPEGRVGNATFTVVAVLGDAVGLAIALLWWRRRVRWHRYEVVDVGDGTVRLRGALGTLTAAAPRDWTARSRPGRVTGRLHLVAEQDVAPGPAEHGLEQRGGSTYVVHGRVLDARRGRADLLVDEGYRLRVETGPHRVTADVRDSTSVVGTLCFTPTVWV